MSIRQSILSWLIDTSHSRHYTVSVRYIKLAFSSSLVARWTLWLRIVYYSNLPQCDLSTRYWVIPWRGTCLTLVHGPISLHWWPICWRGFQSTPSQLLLFQHASWQVVILAAGCLWPPKDCVSGTAVQQPSSAINNTWRKPDDFHTTSEIQKNDHFIYFFYNISVRQSQLKQNKIDVFVVTWPLWILANNW